MLLEPEDGRCDLETGRVASRSVLRVWWNRSALSHRQTRVTPMQKVTSRHSILSRTHVRLRFGYSTKQELPPLSVPVHSTAIDAT